MLQKTNNKNEKQRTEKRNQHCKDSPACRCDGLFFSDFAVNKKEEACSGFFLVSLWLKKSEDRYFDRIIT
jgi:hypothetical protein